MNAIMDVFSIVSQHVGAVLVINGILMTLPKLLRASSVTQLKQLTGELKWYIDQPLGLGQLIMGLFTTYTGAAYIGTVVFQGHPLNLLVPPLLIIGGTGNFAAATRNWTWSVYLGVGAGLLGSAGILSLSAGISPTWIGAAAIIFFLIFYAVWYMTKPMEEILRLYGRGISLGAVAVPFGTLQAIIGVISIPALGLMII